jgi:AcrR family transcriptional regulator
MPRKLQPVRTAKVPGDLEATRARLIDAAGEVFSEHGFQAATVREICSRAGANVAAVNYHFGDKMGLYDAVLRESLCVAAHENVRAVAEQSDSPEHALRLMIAGMLRRMSIVNHPMVSQRGAWHIRIMAHEMARPTEGLDRVIDRVIGPNYGVMRKIVAGIIGFPPEHEMTRLCAHSVIGQVVHYAHARPVIARLWPELTMTEDQIDLIAEHITGFSLAGLRALSSRENNTGSSHT